MHSSFQVGIGGEFRWVRELASMLYAHACHIAFSGLNLTKLFNTMSIFELSPKSALSIKRHF